MPCNYKVALSVALHNSRSTQSTWIVLPDEHGFDVREATGMIPFRTVAAYRNGRKITNSIRRPLKTLAIACGNHPYEDGK